VALQAAASAATDTAQERIARLYAESRGDVYAYVATMLGDRTVAEDVTALAFERAFRRRRLYNPRRGSERAWLFGIARNAALDELRRRTRRSSLTHEPQAQCGDVEDHAEMALRRAVLRAALARLAPRERELIALRFHAGLSHADIAKVIGVSESNAGTLLHRTITKLREACDEEV
jgi:RNA polymerase sigma-70 factor (ECF subfamily)